MKKELKDLEKSVQAQDVQERAGSEHMKTFFIGFAAAFVVLAGIAGLARFVSSDTRAADEDGTIIGLQDSLPGDYHAVFLTNGQVYFGSVTKSLSNEILLEDIYYLQSDKQTIAQGLDNQNELKLIKLGNELHGPEDMMYINREHVLFIEPLKSDSKVVRAIKEYTIK